MCPAFSSDFSDLYGWAASIFGQKYFKNCFKFICNYSIYLWSVVWHLEYSYTIDNGIVELTYHLPLHTVPVAILENGIENQKNTGFLYCWVPTLKRMLAFPHPSQSWVSPNFLISTSLWWVIMVSFKLWSVVGVSRKYFCCSWLLVTVLVSHTWVDRCTHICDTRESVYICVEFHKFHSHGR